MNIDDLINSEQLRIILQKLDQLAGDAVNVGTAIVQVQAIDSLLHIIVGVIITVVLWIVARKLYNHIDFDSYDDDETFLWVMGTGIAIVFAGIGTITCLLKLADVWLWVGIFNPKLALAHQIFEKIFTQASK